MRVTGIGDRAFAGNTGISSAVIPDSVTSIGWGAFQDCELLASITISASVTEIGGSVFSLCSELNSISVAAENTAYSSANGVLFDKKKTTLIAYPGGKEGAYAIPEGVTKIGDNAFFGCTGLSSVTIPASVVEIGGSAFSTCAALTSISVAAGNPAYSSKDGVLFDKKGTTLIAYPGSKGDAYTTHEGVTTIGGQGYTRITRVAYDIPANVTTIGDYAFSGCTGLTSITIPASVTTIGLDAFEGTPWFEKQPDGVVYAGKVLYAYKGEMPANTSIDIAPGTVSISEWAFSGRDRLISVAIPDSVTKIGGSAFSGCAALTAVTVAEENTAYSSKDGVLFDKEGTALIAYPGGREGAYTIPEGVTTIGRLAFSGCAGLTQVAIPLGVTSIGWSAFRGCAGLTQVTIPDSVITIGDFAFWGCTGLTQVTIPDSVIGIGQGAFSGCMGLTQVTIPDSVTTIGDFAFWGCTGLPEETKTAVTARFGNDVF